MVMKVTKVSKQTKQKPSTKQNYGKLLTSTAAAALLDVNQSTVKRWADEGVLKHVRTAGGHRRFRIEDIFEHKKPSHSKIEQWINLLIDHPSPYKVQGNLLLLHDEYGSWAKAMGFITSVMVEFGERWRSNKIQIHEEHLATHRLERSIEQISDSIQTAQRAPLVLLATPSQEFHSLSLCMLELCLKELGWKTIYIGKNTPTSNLVECIKNGTISVVALSASKNFQDAKVLKKIITDLAPVCIANNTKLWLGGGGAWPDPPSYGVRFRSFLRLPSPFDSES